MKLFKLSVTFVMALTVGASAVLPGNVSASVMKNYTMEMNSTDARISQVFDRYNYAMAVEWDQKDPVFKEQAKLELENSLKALKSEGIQAGQIESYMMNKMLDKHSRAEYIKLVAAMNTQNLSIEDASKVIMNFVERSAQTGTNFHGDLQFRCGAICIVVPIVVVALIMYQLREHHRALAAEEAEAAAEEDGGGEEMAVAE